MGLHGEDKLTGSHSGPWPRAVLFLDLHRIWASYVAGALAGRSWVSCFANSLSGIDVASARAGAGTARLEHPRGLAGSLVRSMRAVARGLPS